MYELHHQGQVAQHEKDSPAPNQCYEPGIPEISLAQQTIKMTTISQMQYNEKALSGQATINAINNQQPMTDSPYNGTQANTTAS